ncbi:MAG TPA: tripartite tricarboxylate transporter substrate-binding protein [Xanthobacteraceae bacterium]|jgi:hypothetical protein|nr:tripartite tricarboxylate transporter substrate-binding protein [Xanthobacteraceae bacterium]
MIPASSLGRLAGASPVFADSFGRQPPPLEFLLRSAVEAFSAASARCWPVFPAASAVTEEVKQGRLRALAVTTTHRSQALPGVPTLSEFIPGYEARARGTGSARRMAHAVP